MEYLRKTTRCHLHRSRGEAQCTRRRLDHCSHAARDLQASGWKYSRLISCAVHSCSRPGIKGVRCECLGCCLWQIEVTSREQVTADEELSADTVFDFLTAFIKDPSEFVAKIKVPVQMFAGTADTYKDCCLIETARQLADAAKGTATPMLALHEYNGVGHGFNLATAARKDQAAGQDAMERCGCVTRGCCQSFLAVVV